MRTKTLLLVGIPVSLLLASTAILAEKGGARISSYAASVANPSGDASKISHTGAPPPRNRPSLAQKANAWNAIKIANAPFAQRPFIASVVTNTVAVVPKAKAAPEFLAVVNQPEILMNQKVIANEILTTILPANCRDTLKNLYVKYEKQKSRGLAGKDVMILDGTVSDPEFRALFIHESGHNIDLGCLRGTADGGVSGFMDGNDPIYNNDPSLGFYKISWITTNVQRSDGHPEDFASGYASYDAFEDFAEGFAYFILQNDAFKLRAQTNAAMAKKYAFFQNTIFGGTVPNFAKGQSEWTGKAPWDVTKLPYVWNGNMNVAQR